MHPIKERTLSSILKSNIKLFVCMAEFLYAVGLRRIKIPSPTHQKMSVWDQNLILTWICPKNIRGLFLFCRLCSSVKIGKDLYRYNSTLLYISVL